MHCIPCMMITLPLRLNNYITHANEHAAHHTDKFELTVRRNYLSTNRPVKIRRARQIIIGKAASGAAGVWSENAEGKAAQYSRHYEGSAGVPREKIKPRRAVRAYYTGTRANLKCKSGVPTRDENIPAKLFEPGSRRAGHCELSVSRS